MHALKDCIISFDYTSITVKVIFWATQRPAMVEVSKKRLETPKILCRDLRRNQYKILRWLLTINHIPYHCCCSNAYQKMKPENNLNPILLNEEAYLPSFASLRERNLKTLYGDTKISEYINNDKSPKGSVDEKIRPLVNLINLHPEFVTLSSCSGRVAMFDPEGIFCLTYVRTSLIDVKSKSRNYLK